MRHGANVNVRDAPRGGLFNHDLTLLDYQTLSQRRKRSPAEIRKRKGLNADLPSGVAVAAKTKRSVEPRPEVFLPVWRRNCPCEPSREVALIRQTKGIGKKRTKRW